MKKGELDRIWDNLKTNFTEAYFELKEDTDMNKNHVGFVVNDNIDHPHVE